MREKLIDMLVDFFGENDDFNVDMLVNYLIDNGVVVLPCKAGDLVYKIIDMDNFARRILECQILEITIRETEICFFSKVTKKVRYRYDSFKIDDIGKTVFFTREEAEKALERSKQ